MVELSEFVANLLQCRAQLSAGTINDDQNKLEEAIKCFEKAYYPNLAQEHQRIFRFARCWEANSFRVSWISRTMLQKSHTRNSVEGAICGFIAPAHPTAAP